VAFDIQSVLAGLTIATGIFLAGRFLGTLEERVNKKNGYEYDCREQLELLHRKLDKHISRSTSAGSIEESD